MHKIPDFSSMSCLFGIRNVSLWIIWFNFLKSDKNMIESLFFSWIYLGSHHSILFSLLSTVIFQILSTSFLNIYSCALGTGYVLAQYVLESVYSSIYTGLVFQVHIFLSKSNSYLLNVSQIIPSSYYGECLFSDANVLMLSSY